MNDAQNSANICRKGMGQYESSNSRYAILLQQGTSLNFFVQNREYTVIGCLGDVEGGKKGD